MTARWTLAAALGLSLALAVAAVDPPAPAGSAREVVYFGPAGPVRIRLHVTLDGKPVDEVWDAAIAAVFAHADRNGDGVLDEKERAAFAAPTGRQQDVQMIREPGGVPPLRLSFNAKDKVTRTAFADAVRSAGYGAISLKVVPTRADSPRLSAALFRHLDANGDGRLDVAELRAARDRLAGLDTDEDEYISAAELLGRGTAGNPDRVRRVVGGRQPAAPADPSRDLLMLPADPEQAAKELLAARGGSRATALRPADLGADPKAFAAIDADGNGRLDAAELAAWFRREPGIELTLAFDADKARLTATKPAPVNGAVIVAGGRFQIEPPDAAAWLRPGWDKAVVHLRGLYASSAAERGNPYLMRDQIEKMPPLLAVFDFADRNGDSKIDKTEIVTALAVLAPLARCRVEVTVTDLGSGLFELLDRDGDGRLSPRELVDAATSLKPYLSPDGTIGPKDLTRQFRVRSAVEPIPVGLLQPGTAPPIEAPYPRTFLPLWFTKMDRNGDGEVSLREWVGPVELFRKLDRNGDGLISPDEAAAGKE